MPNLIEWVESLAATGKNLMQTEQDEKEYPRFAVNRGISQHIDTVMYAAEMNKRPGLSSRMQYAFMLAGIKKQKRYGKWAKKTETNMEHIELVSKVYNISHEKAAAACRILTPDQIAQLKAHADPGGVKRNGKSN